MSKNDKNTLRPVQWLAISHLASGKTHSETAALVDVSRQTIQNWLNGDLFRQELKRVEKKRLNQLVRKYQEAQNRSFEVLKTIMNDENAKAYDRIRAAVEINKGARWFRELQEFEERLSSLERESQDHQ